MLYSRFKKIMVLLNCLFAIPVIWVIVRELLRPGEIRVSRVLAIAALVALPLAGTIAITIAGYGVLRDD